MKRPDLLTCDRVALIQYINERGQNKHPNDVTSATAYAYGTALSVIEDLLAQRDAMRAERTDP